MPGSRTKPASSKFFSPSQLRRLRGREQVAAVCYRVSDRGIEFLLVQTRGGRWTFPKGGTEPGLTHAQAAALEAFEEAGVHGRIEEASFARYIRRQRQRRKSARTELVVNAHLCEVTRLGSPQEAKRNPRWFPPEKAKRRLRKDRAGADGAEMASVVDCAVSRIQRRLCGTAAVGEGQSKDGLQKVQFEAWEGIRLPGPMQEALFGRYVRRQAGQLQDAAAVELAARAPISKVLPLNPGEKSERRILQFSSAKRHRRLPSDTDKALGGSSQ